MTSMADIAALILAAGSASRFRAGQAQAKTKLVQDFRGWPMVRHAALAAIRSRARPVIVVTGFEASDVRAALAGLDLEFVDNAAFASGLSSSLKRGIAALGPQCRGAVILLADMPQVGATLIDRLIEGFDATPDVDAVVPVWAGQRGNPVLLGRRIFAAIDTLEGDQGARRLLAQPSLEILEIPSDDPAIAADVDTPAMLAALEGVAGSDVSASSKPGREPNEAGAKGD
jgi:molybdenum cofactor cytidylyltransferase